jgi:hypothetical protein
VSDTLAIHSLSTHVVNRLQKNEGNGTVRCRPFVFISLCSCIVYRSSGRATRTAQPLHPGRVRRPSADRGRTDGRACALACLSLLGFFSCIVHTLSIPMSRLSASSLSSHPPSPRCDPGTVLVLRARQHQLQITQEKLEGGPEARPRFHDGERESSGSPYLTGRPGRPFVLRA